MDSFLRLLKRFGQVPYGWLLALFIVSALISVSALRANNQTMIKLRDAVYQADKNNGDVSSALNNLRGYVYAHMNTDLSSGGNTIKPPIQLKYTYERLQTADQAQVNSANTQIYTDAENYCQAQNSTDFSGRNRVPCVTEYVTSHGNQTKDIPTALYQFDFISPSWSPDLAGWSLVVTFVSFIAFSLALLLARVPRYKRA